MTKEERLQLENELLMTCSKAQAINKYIDELEESSKLTELWCKSQEENRELQQRINKAIKYIDDMCLCSLGYSNYGDDLSPKHIVEILKGGEDNR